MLLLGTVDEIIDLVVGIILMHAGNSVQQWPLQMDKAER